MLGGLDGEWRDLGNQKQYFMENGAVLNFWESTGTVNFQGPVPAAKKLEALVLGTRPVAQSKT